MVWIVIALAVLVIGYVALPEIVAITLLSGDDSAGTFFYRFLAFVFIAALGIGIWSCF